MITEAQLVQKAEEAARRGKEFGRWWIDSVCQDPSMVARYLNAEMHGRCLDAYDRIRPPEPVKGQGQCRPANSAASR